MLSENVSGPDHASPRLPAPLEPAARNLFDAAMETARSENVLEVKGLRVVFPTRTGDFAAVEDVSIEVRRGEILGIVGESGAGKSTIGAAVLQLIDYPGYVAAGSIRLSGEELVGKSDDELGKIRGHRIGAIFQDASTALSPVHSIGSQIVRAVRLHAPVSKRAARRRAVELLGMVGIPDPETRLRQYAHQFSGGMRQRVVIAIALAHRPELVIADEPTTALDVSIQSEILDTIRRLCTELRTGVILITHNMAVISEVTDRVAVMRHGRLVEIGPTASVLSVPSHPYTRSLIGAVPRTDRKLGRFELLAADTEAAAPAAPRGLSWFGGRVEDASDTALSVEGLGVTFVTRKAILPSRRRTLAAVDDVSFRVRRGEVFGLVGESGSGKSTLARMVCGLEAPGRGRVRYKGRDITALATDRALRRACLDMQMIFQDPFASLDPRQRVGELLVEPMRVHKLAPPSEFGAIVRDVLERVGLGAAAADRLPHQFSGGQRQRICIARALVMRPAFLICDEPTSALDVSVQAQILNLLKDLQEDLGLTMLFISHDLAVIRQMCDHVGVMKSGQLCEVGPVDAVFDAPRHDYTKRLLALMPKFSPQQAA